MPIGEIVSRHGVRGELRMKPYNPQTTTPADVRDLRFHHDRDSADDRGGPARRIFEIHRARPHKSVWLLQMEQIDDADRATAWIGAKVSARASDLPPLESGEYYHWQLVGLEVVGEQGEAFGRVREILVTGGADVLVLEANGVERMLPMIDDFVVSIDLGARRIVVKPPSGLFEEKPS